MPKVELTVTGLAHTSFNMEFEPHSEKDLLRSKEYKKFYYEVGVGAPIEATVTTKTGLFSKESYSFEFTVKGNSWTFSKFSKKLKENDAKGKCEYYGVQDNTHQFLYSFPDYNTAYDFYKQFDGICNIGAYHSKYMGIDIVKLEYHPVPFDDAEDSIPETEIVKPVQKATKVIGREELLQYSLSPLQKDYSIFIPEKLDEMFRSIDAVINYLIENTLKYAEQTNQLNCKADYGKVEQLIAINSFYTGMYVVETKMHDKSCVFPGSLLKNHAIYDLKLSVLDELGIESDSPEEIIIHNIFYTVLPVLANISNEASSAEQTHEVFATLMKLGGIVEYTKSIGKLHQI